MSRKWLHHIRAFDARGNLVFHTKHATLSSMQIEIDAWKARASRDESPSSWLQVTDVLNGKVDNIQLPLPKKNPRTFGG